MRWGGITTRCCAAACKPWLIAWLPGSGDSPQVLNASGRAPFAWTPQRFEGRATMPLTGWESVTVPGAPAGWWRLSERAGRLPFGALFVDAIRIA